MNKELLVDKLLDYFIKEDSNYKNIIIPKK